jgi:hypothetical protein
LLASFSAQAAEPATPAKPTTAPTTSPWGVKQVLAGDPSLPHVLLIGDSILNGYNGQAVVLLRGKVNLDIWVTPKHVGGIGGDLKGVLGAHDYDLILFNDIGLHAWQPGRIPEGKYEPLLRAHLAHLHELAPKARLVFATTTPIITKAKPFAIDPERNPVIVERNAVAMKVMEEDHVPVADFYKELVATPELSAGDSFHWTRSAYARIARLAADQIAAALKFSLSTSQPTPGT